MDLRLVTVACVVVWLVTESGWVSAYMTCCLVTFAKEYSELGSLIFCSLINKFCCWRTLYYINIIRYCSLLKRHKSGMHDLRTGCIDGFVYVNDIKFV